jgi:hypothetical protein
MKTINFFKKMTLFLVVFGISWPMIAVAEEGLGSAGELAQNVMTGAMVIKEIMRDLCLIGGAFLILSSFFQYMRFRRNPSEMTIGRPITTLIVGVVLIAITFIPWQI